MKISSILIILGFVVLTACQRNRLKIDVSDSRVKIKLNRLEKDLFELPDEQFESVGWLEEKHGDFFKIFTYKMIRIGGSGDSLFIPMLNKFRKDTFVRQVYDKTINIYDDISWLEEGFTDAFRHYNHYFPDKKIPKIYTCVSGLNQSIVTAGNTIGISLDKYLGVDCEYYPQMMTPQYKQRNMHKDKILPDVMLGWAYTEFAYNDSKDNLLSQMIYHGKMMYFLDAMLPDQPDTLKIGYTAKQLDFCELSEEGFWTFFMEQKLLFSTEQYVKRRYIRDAPYTADFSAQSPGRTGIWVGWQIVRSYMDRHRGVTLKELMNNDDYQSILNQSGYAPGR